MFVIDKGALKVLDATMPKVRGNPSEKWVRRAGAATEDYTQGVKNPRRAWAAATTEAAGAQAAGVQAAIARQAFAKGVAKAGDAKWQDKSVRKGGPRFAGGVQEGVNDYATNVAPYLQVIESTALPPRGPKGDPRNIQRVAAIATALRNRKMQGG